VVDGDTAKVFYEGDSEYVRYIGIDTPEMNQDGQPGCFGEEATAANESLLGDGTARLVFGPELRDRFGRLLAYVYVRDLMLNAELLREGYAETLTIPPNDARSGQFERLEAEAQDAGRGRWRTCG
jgi:micrococcal nuclease